MKRLIIIGIVSLLCTLSHSQHYIGFGKEEIIVKMKQDFPEFIYQKGMVNPKFNYLKFVDLLERRTILFFLDDNNRCTFIRFMLDYSYLREIREQYGKNYIQVNGDEWIDTTGKEPVTISLKEDEWYFTLTIQLKK